MSEVKFKHISAITSSIKLLQTCLDDRFQQRLHKQVEQDQKSLIEARDILLKMYRNPTLPFLDGNVEPIPLEPSVKSD